MQHRKSIRPEKKEHFLPIAAGSRSRNLRNFVCFFFYEDVIVLLHLVFGGGRGGDGGGKENFDAWDVIVGNQVGTSLT